MDFDGGGEYEENPGGNILYVSAQSSLSLDKFGYQGKCKTCMTLRGEGGGLR